MNNKLHTYRFNADLPKALVFIFHGMHCASNCYTHIANRISQEKIAVFAFDQEGHGKSEGKRGRIRDYDAYVSCAIEYIVKTKEFYPENTPIFLLGESMGGAIAISTALQIPDMIRGLILYAPSLGVNPDLAPFLQRIVRCVASCWVGFPMMSQDLAIGSRNPYNTEWWMANPDLYHGKLEAGTGAALLRGFQELGSQIDMLKTSFILFQGGHDNVVSESMARDFVKSSKVEDKEFVYYPEMYHAVSADPEIYEIMEKTVEWINNRL